jgi:hypothetical protein
MHSFLGAQLLGVALYFRLHPQCCKQCSLRVVFARDRRAEQGQDAVAGGLHDITFIVVDSVDHELERRIDDGAGVLRIEVLDQLHRTFDVGEHHGNGLALTLEIFRGGCLRDENWPIARFQSRGS